MRPPQTTLRCANGGVAAARYVATASPMPGPPARPALIAAFSSRPGLFGHAEAARPERLVDVLRRRAAERDLEVVDDARAVRGERRHKAALHQVDQHGPEPGLDDVRAEAPDDARAVRAAPRRSARTTARKSAAASMSRQRRRSSPATPLPGINGRAKSSARALLARDASGYVRTSERSNSSYGMRGGYRKVGTTVSPVPGSRRVQPSQNEHGVAVAVEPVAIL